MNARLKPVLIGVAAIALALLAYFGWVATHDKSWFDRPLPVEGEASYNDFYVVQQALRVQGVKVQSLPHLPEGIDHWNASDSLLLGSDLKTLSPVQLDALLDWVGRGGRLIVTTSFDRGEDNTGLLNRIGVAVPKRGYSCMDWQDAGKDHVADCYTTFMIQGSERENFQSTVGNDDGWIAATRTWGLGRIEVIGDFDMLRNRQLDAARNIDWAWQLLAPMLQPDGTLHIVYQTELPPLYVYLVRNGWFALLPLFIALLAWLWARSQRFGPSQNLPDPDRRALGEHIQATGEYLYRRGLIPALYAPLRRRFDDQLRRRDPELAALPTADIARALALRQKLPLESVQQALRPPQPRQHKAFLTTVQTLLRMIRHL
jgi:hypothetical protein